MASGRFVTIFTSPYPVSRKLQAPVESASNTSTFLGVGYAQVHNVQSNYRQFGNISPRKSKHRQYKLRITVPEDCQLQYLYGTVSSSYLCTPFRNNNIIAPERKRAIFCSLTSRLGRKAAMLPRLIPHYCLLKTHYPSHRHGLSAVWCWYSIVVCVLRSAVSTTLNVSRQSDIQVRSSRSQSACIDSQSICGYRRARDNPRQGPQSKCHRAAIFIVTSRGACINPRRSCRPEHLFVSSFT